MTEHSPDTDDPERDAGDDSASTRPGDDPGSDDPRTDDGSGGPERYDPEERYRKLFEYSNDAIMVVDLETESFLEVNPAACRMLGYDRAELLDLHPEDIHPEDMDRVREEFLSQVVEEGEGFTDDLVCVTKDGSEVPTEVSGAALGVGGSDTPTRMVAILRDISERVRARERLESEIDRLDRFADVVSHDLRSPLNVISLRTDLARETGDPEHFDAIEAAVDRMDAMLEDIMRVTRHGDAIDERSAVDLAEVCRDAWRDVETRDATLTVTSSVTFRADRGRLRELFENLFRNSVQHGSTGDRSGGDDEPDADPAIRVGTLRGEEQGFFVADDGPGIPPDEREDVFEWGYTTARRGTGFGLGIVSEVVEAHGWTVSITESDGGGARFEVTGIETSGKVEDGDRG